MRRLGIDIGSLTIGTVLLDDDGVKGFDYRAHDGKILKNLHEVLGLAPFRDFDMVGVTGNFEARSGDIFDAVLAQAEGVRWLFPAARDVIAVGGETFGLIRFDDQGDYREHTINPPCASGTGSFIDQQAERLGFDVADLAEKASAFDGPVPPIATRCAVFAKTDIVHAMQEGYSAEAVAAGLCEGVAGSVVDAVLKGRELRGPVAVIGGVSLNKKIVHTLESLLGLKVAVPGYSTLVGACGAALLGRGEGIVGFTDSRPGRAIDLEKLLIGAHGSRRIRAPLAGTLEGYPDFRGFDFHHRGDVEIMLPRDRPVLQGAGFVGIDIGSTSTKAVLINANSEILGGFYTRTAGEPVKAVQALTHAMADEFPGTDSSIAGVGTTGSGRKMIKELFRADLEVNEITAHAKAAVVLNPDVDTIIEIGGQDSKFTRIRNGEVYFSSMNYVCAAGTGSFIEEQAKRLGVSLDTFSDLALGARAPFTSDRCTVYMDRDLGVLLGEGWDRAALCAAVLNSVRDNYITKVVSRSPMGENIVFQGATARNRALVAAFEQELGRPVGVSAYCHLTGAYGAALLVREAAEKPDGTRGTKVSRFAFGLEDAESHEELCDRCVNRCLLTVIGTGDEKSAWGMKCGREYTERAPTKMAKSLPERRYEEDFAPLYRTDPSTSLRGGPDRGTIGLPESLFNKPFAPLWFRFLTDLGYRVHRSRPGEKVISDGKAVVNSDFCAPMVAAHGYARQMEQAEVDYVFSPALRNSDETDPNRERTFQKKKEDSYFCYYSQYLPTVLSALTSLSFGDRLLSPLVSFGDQSTEEIARSIHNELTTVAGYDGPADETTSAFVSAWTMYQKVLRDRRTRYRPGPAGRNFRIALLGRPYVAFDSALNLGILSALEAAGAEVFWQDEFDLEKYDLDFARRFDDRMHWHYGKRILALAEYAARSDELYVVFLSCFRCSPDSFLINYVKEIMDHYGKPFLVLQLDEHGSDVGYTTRIEAGLRSFRNHFRGSRGPKPSPVVPIPEPLLEDGDTVLIPYLDQLVSRFWADCFTRAGYDAVLLDARQDSLNIGYRFANGGECMPLVSIIGSAVETMGRLDLRPENTFLYLPTVCLACNFPQFPVAARSALESAGFSGTKVGFINSMAPGASLPGTLASKMLESNILGGLIYKSYFRVKPYEVVPGSSDAALIDAGNVVSRAVLDGKSLVEAGQEVADLFIDIERDESSGRKPRIGLLGDIYVKFNETMNQDLQALVDELGGELVIPSLTEYPFHFYDADIRLHDGNSRSYRFLRRIEGRFEEPFADLLAEMEEPDFAECVAMMEEYGIKHYLAGETSISVGRALYFIRKGLVDGLLHLNPIFCCPGVVSASIFRKIQEDFGIPIVDIFYDGTGSPNRVVVPHIHYLREKLRNRTL